MKKLCIVLLALLCLTAKNYEDSTLGEKAEAYYESCGFGYGEGRDGFLWVYDADADQVTLFSFGAAEGIVTQDYEAFITDAALSLKEEHGIADEDHRGEIGGTAWTWGHLEAAMWIAGVILDNNMEYFLKYSFFCIG